MVWQRTKLWLHTNIGTPPIPLAYAQHSPRARHGRCPTYPVRLSGRQFTRAAAGESSYGSLRAWVLVWPAASLQALGGYGFTTEGGDLAMPTGSVHVVVFDGFADWEPAYALAELRRSGNRQITAVGFNKSPVVSMGGLQVVPEDALANVRARDVALLILPGGDLWEGEYPRGDLEALVLSLVSAGVPVAAICAGTLALARAGLLDDRRHTSNMPDYLGKHVAEYRGRDNYDPALAVNDRGVITASGLGPVEFARAIFRELGVFSESDEQLWFDMFKHGQMP